MAISYGAFGSGATTVPAHTRTSDATVTTATNPYHPEDHNAYDAAFNQVKAEHNGHIGTVPFWLAVNGVTTPWAFGTGNAQVDSANSPIGTGDGDGLFESLYVNGVVKFGNAAAGSTPLGSTVGDRGTWTPIVTDVTSAGHPTQGTINANWVCEWERIGPYSYDISVYMRVTAPWSGIQCVQISLPAGLKQYNIEQMPQGWLCTGSGAFGLHYPVTGIIHSKPQASGGDANGVSNQAGSTTNSNEPTLRFIVPSKY